MILFPSLDIVNEYILRFLQYVLLTIALPLRFVPNRIKLYAHTCEPDFAEKTSLLTAILLLHI